MLRPIITTHRDTHYDNRLLDFASTIRTQMEKHFYVYELENQRILLSFCNWNCDRRSTPDM